MIWNMILSFCCLQSSGGTPSAWTDEPATHLNCGAYCLYTGLLGLELYEGGYDDLERELGPPGALGYSIAQLQEVAERHGAHALAVKSNLAQLPNHRRPFACIALLDNQHFVLAADVTAADVAVVDPPRSYALPRDTFESRWDGRALLLAPEPIEVLTPFPWRTVGWVATGLLAAVATGVGVKKILAHRG